MPTDPRYAPAENYPGRPHPPSGYESNAPSVYEDLGYGSDAVLDAFTGDMAEAPPVDPSALFAHDVTAVLVAHNGGRWLPRTLEALTALDRAPDRIVAVDTGSKDDSARLLTAALGAPAVISAPRSTGFGAAVNLGVESADDAVHTGTNTARLGYEPTSWIWLLHDDSAPDPDTLRRLLETAVRHPEAGVIGPKVRGWRDDRQLLEVGLTITGGGRRHTGLDRREYDQGQHDVAREVLAVGSAGMLIRRDVWDMLEGFDPQLSIFRDDIDFGWRANQAGFAVVVSPEAVVYHAEAAAHGRRRLGATRDRPHLADRRNAVYVLLANTPGRSFLFTMLRVIVGGIARAIGFLLGKQPALAAEEFLAVASVVGRPDRLIRARMLRRRVRTAGADQLKRLFPPASQQLRHASENVMGVLSGSSSGHDVPGSARRASTGNEDDDLPDDDDTFLLKVLLHPAVLLTVGLVVVTLLAIRGLVGTGRLTGGALLPAPDSVAELWQTYTEAWHGVGLGSPTDAPPYLAVVGVLATIVRSASLAVDLLLLVSVPLAGLTAYLLARRLVSSRMLQVWAAVTYALLPATTGAIAAGRLGTAVAAVVTPLVVLAVMRTLGRPGAPGPFRAAWSAGLLLAVTAAFVPLAWMLALVVGIVAVATLYRDRSSALRIVAILAVTPVVIFPWTGTLLSTPMLWVTEAGKPGPALSDPSLAPWAVLLQHPGGPGAAPMWLGVGLVAAGWAALWRRDRRGAVATAWVVAMAALVAGVVLTRIPVTGPTLETPVAGWPGFPTVVIGGALLAAAAMGAEGIRDRVSRATFGWRQPLAAVVVIAAALTPLVASGWWVARGADDPLARRDPSILPAYVADEAARPDRIRTLVLAKADDGRITYALLRASGPRLGDAETGPPAEAYAPLDDVVADLVSGRGGADGARLAQFATKYVYLPRPFDPDLADTLDTVPGLVRSSAPEGAAMWRVDQQVGRIWLAEAAENADGGADDVTPALDGDGVPITVPSGDVEASGTVPDGGERRFVVLSELADPGWSATLGGEPLEATTVDGWAQGFEVGATGGDFELTHRGDQRSLWLWLQLAAVVVAVVLALPGIRRERGAVDDASDLDPDEVTDPNLAVVTAAPATAMAPPAALPQRPQPSSPPAARPSLNPWARRAPQDEVVTRPIQTRPPASEQPEDAADPGSPASGGRRRRRASPADETTGGPGGTGTPSVPQADTDSDTDAPAAAGRSRYKGKRAAGRRAAGRRKGRRDEGGDR